MSSHSTKRPRYGDQPDLQTWLLENAGDNADAVARVQKNLALAIREELTGRQQQVLRMYYFDRRKMTDIAEELKVSASTISRTVKRAEDRLYRALKYTF